MSTSSRPAVDFNRAVIDPAAAFDSPEEVLREVRLPLAGEIEILCRWAYDSAELSVAEEEGMDGGESMDMSAILKALDEITHVDAQHRAPTKHAAFCGKSQSPPAEPAGERVAERARSRVPNRGPDGRAVPHAAP